MACHSQPQDLFMVEWLTWTFQLQANLKKVLHHLPIALFKKGITGYRTGSKHIGWDSANFFTKSCWVFIFTQALPYVAFAHKVPMIPCIAFGGSQVGLPPSFSISRKQDWILPPDFIPYRHFVHMSPSQIQKRLSTISANQQHHLWPYKISTSEIVIKSFPQTAICITSQILSRKYNSLQHGQEMNSKEWCWIISTLNTAKTSSNYYPPPAILKQFKIVI